MRLAISIAVIYQYGHRNAAQHLVEFIGVNSMYPLFEMCACYQYKHHRRPSLHMFVFVCVSVCMCVHACVFVCVSPPNVA